MRFKRVMIVAHPDDEILWGASALENYNDWLVISITNGDDNTRADKFHKAMDIFKCERQIWSFPDLAGLKFDSATISMLRDRLRPILNSLNVEMVLTHGPEGEYGHITHIEVSSIVKSCIENASKLFYFSFKYKENTQLSPKVRDALSVYYPGFADCYNLYSFRDIPTGKYLKHIAGRLFDRKENRINVIKQILKSYNGNFKRSLIKEVISREHMLESDLSHIRLSKFSGIANSTDFNTDSKLLSRIYDGDKELYSFEDVYHLNKNLYENYLDRKYMITKFLPTCFGKTLSVGCHEYNSFDCYATPNCKEFETIDIDERWRIYGSPYKHQTIDFLDYSPSYKFKNIILFGVMGIPYKLEGDSDTYSLYEKDEDIVRHVDEILEIGGQVLFGPDISVDESKSSVDKIRHWNDFQQSNRLLNEKYKLKFKLSTDTNFVLVFEKIK